MITGQTRLYGVLGHPVGHSLSPAMQNAAFRAAGLDAAYVALPVRPERLPEALRGARALGFAGLNVTVPHKQDTAKLCARLDPVAAVCGAVNTLVPSAFHDEGWEGHNTDAPALRALLAEAGVHRGARALLLGAGGAALAGAWALLSHGADLTVAARRADAARALERRMAEAFPGGGAALVVDWDEARERSRAADVLVNATTIGLGGEGELAGLALAPGSVVVDFVYGPTALVRGAREAGAKVVTGEAILVRQGALAFTLWTGQPAPEPVMTEALRQASPASHAAPAPSTPP